MIYAILILTLFAMKKKTSGSGLSSSSQFAKALYPWLAERAGGLSNSGEAGDARLKRAPCEAIKNGQVMNPNPHTSADVTWSTYLYRAPQLGIRPSCEDWIAMSNPLESRSASWFKFVDYYRRKGLKYSSNPVLSAYMGLWYWGGWDQAIMPVKAVLDVLQSSLSDTLKLKRLVELRKQYFRALKVKYGYSQNWLDAVEHRADLYLQDFENFL